MMIITTLIMSITITMIPQCPTWVFSKQKTVLHFRPSSALYLMVMVSTFKRTSLYDISSVFYLKKAKQSHLP